MFQLCRHFDLMSDICLVTFQISIYFRLSRYRMQIPLYLTEVT